MRVLLVFCGLSFLAPAISISPALAQEFHDDVVIVLDASGSMKSPLSGTRVSKMDAAKTALKTVLQKVPPSTHIGLLVFGAANLTSDWVYPLAARDDTVLTQAIDQIEASRGTPLGEYIKKGADRLLEERAKQFGYGSYRLLVVTDGEAQDQELVDRYTPDVISRGITMDVIGVGMKQDHTLARKVHSYRRANDPAALSRAITEAFAEIAGTPSNAAQAEAFELLAPIPGEVALAMIQALSSSGNHPIGTKPARALESASPAKVRVASPQPIHSPVGAVPVSPAPPTPTPPRKHFPVWTFILLAVVVLSIFGRIKKGVRR